MAERSGSKSVNVVELEMATLGPGSESGIISLRLVVTSL